MKEKVRIGFLGLGGRGQGLLKLILNMADVEVPAVCDLYDDRIKAGINIVSEARDYTPTGYSDYRQLLKREDIDAVIIATSWQTHGRITAAAMRAGKYAAFEVGGASSVEECWELVRAYEETGIWCMMLENCCYGELELALLNMIKQGLFGELIHCQGAYGHDLRGEITGGIENRHYRFRNFQHRNGELYPTHELGPICNMLNINRGNRLLTLTAMSTKSRGLHEYALKNKPEYANVDWAQGDVTTTMIKCAHGETILLKHDCSLPRSYSREIWVQGTNGIAVELGDKIVIQGRSPEGGWMEFEWEALSKYIEEFRHPLWTWFREAGVKGGHGGMDYLVQRAFIESVKEGKLPPIDVYDSATWMSITCLTEQSIYMGSMPVAVPDFTNGMWIDRRPDPKCRYSLDAVHNDLF
ncbi:MAG: Gfo/Idh/MocA family oxidoreductase [Clostridiales bacterium]|nr:Gfo/Idh/MocA family oxidoreductase [Clostridiales bacterium]